MRKIFIGLSCTFAGGQSSASLATALLYPIKINK
jgi:hypothetical protein